MSKHDVKTWQRALSDMGLYSGLVDGVFGEGTRRASFEALSENDALEVPTHRITASLVMANQRATRNKPITKNLRDKMIDAATEVYGAGAKIVVYSGGQDRRGRGSRRTGSIRHDDYGRGGRAADVYIYVNGEKLSGVELAKLGQYWLAKGYGACGLEMATGGIHLDEWTTPPKGGGMFWTYKFSDGKSWGKQVKAMLSAGARGEMP